jgi:catechol 2,3-dioxygenase-like lactoylglutathione lyase family enzyme
MRIEHTALNVPDPVAMADWYVKHLGFRVVMRKTESPFMHFLADEGGMMIEIYHNPRAAVPDYRSIDPLIAHIALSAGDVDAERARLLAAGAADAGSIAVTPDGDQIVFIRDPWGVALQLVKRKKAMV